MVAESKVSQLDVVVVIEQQVLCLEVSMYDAFVVAVVHSSDNLSKLLPRLSFGHPAVLNEIFCRMTRVDDKMIICTYMYVCCMYV